MVENGSHERPQDLGKLDTIAIHGARGPRTNGAAVLPVHNSVTYGFSGPAKDGQWGYTRPADTPNHQASLSARSMPRSRHALIKPMCAKIPIKARSKYYIAIKHFLHDARAQTEPSAILCTTPHAAPACRPWQQRWRCSRAQRMLL